MTVDKPLSAPDPEFLREPDGPGAGPAQGGQREAAGRAELPAAGPLQALQGHLDQQ